MRRAAKRAKPARPVGRKAPRRTGRLGRRKATPAPAPWPPVGAAAGKRPDFLDGNSAPGATTTLVERTAPTPDPEKPVDRPFIPRVPPRMPGSASNLKPWQQEMLRQKRCIDCGSNKMARGHLRCSPCERQCAKVPGTSMGYSLPPTAKPTAEPKPFERPVADRDAEVKRPKVDDNEGATTHDLAGMEGDE